MLNGKQQSSACTILHRRRPCPMQLALTAITPEVLNPYQAIANRPTAQVRSANDRLVGRRHIVEVLTPAVFEQNSTIRCANTASTLLIAPGSITDRNNLGAAEVFVIFLVCLG